MTRNSAFIFPGQGSQKIGMLAEMAQVYPMVVETFTEASDALGFDLWALCSEGDESVLNQTANTQPALLAASVALWRVWNEAGGAQPCVMAGHSLGEYSALVCAGVLEFKAGVELVAHRGRLMQEAVAAGEGAMAAIIGLENDKVTEICRQCAQDSLVVEAVNFNSPGQVVIAGHKTAVEDAMAQAKSAGAKMNVLLPVSIPSHCILMKPAAVLLSDAMETLTFSAPRIAVINNVDGAEEHDPQQIKEALVRQLYQPVLWSESIEKIRSMSVDSMIECGPGKVLSGLNKRIDKRIRSFNIDFPEAMRQAIADLTD